MRPLVDEYVYINASVNSALALVLRYMKPYYTGVASMTVAIGNVVYKYELDVKSKSVHVYLDGNMAWKDVTSASLVARRVFLDNIDDFLEEVYQIVAENRKSLKDTTDKSVEIICQWHNTFAKEFGT